MKQLKIYASLGKEVSIGWARDDVPMVHCFASVLPGKNFKPSNGRGGPHWPCTVCDAHNYSENDFHTQMQALMRAQERMIARAQKAGVN